MHTSTTTEVIAQLSVGAASETVTVEAADVQVQTSSAEVGEVVSGTQVRELPLNGENFMGLVTLSPGVSTANSFNSRDKGLTGGADFSVNGNPYNYNLFLVDGVNNNDVGSGRTILVYPSVDAIAEFKMIRNSYGPEYGQAAGAIISITTRSGENQFHGGFFYAGRNDKLDANDWFSNFNGTGKAELRRNDWGYHVAGPVLKDKLFFWWNQEWNREVRGSVSRCLRTNGGRTGRRLRRRLRRAKRLRRRQSRRDAGYGPVRRDPTRGLGSQRSWRQYLYFADPGGPAGTPEILSRLPTPIRPAR